jgi:hypothetical protein
VATITTDQYLDGGTARTAGEAMAIGSGAKLTIRTDTRVHANAPASFTGSLSSPTFTDIGGELYIDATAVRWLPFDTGSSTVPAIGTTVSRSGVSGYLLGVWATLASAPTAVGAAMPTTGFIKFREVTGGPFGAGALTGIGASATGPDVTGWIECAWDAGVNFVVGRVGKMKSRGAWFYLDNTNGSVGQIIQVPSSSAATNNNCPGAWVESAPGSNTYEFWTGLKNSSNGWSRLNLGFAEGYTDARGKFCLANAAGTLQFGQSATLAATYATVAGQASTYAAVTLSATYTWAANVVTVDCGANAHLLDDGQVIGLDFTSGSGVDAADFVVTVIDAYRFSCARTGSGTGGNVTVRPGLAISFATHGLHHGEQVYCDFTSGGGVDGVYTIYARTGTGTYNIAYPTTGSVASGNVTCQHTLQITYTAHGHVAGNEVYCDFTSGGATSGRYIMRATAANTININYPFAAAITTSNVTLKWTVGHVPASGCKVRIPNILFAECATASRATNSVPNATIDSRPQFTFATAGAADLEYLYCWSALANFDQAYSVHLYHCAFPDVLQVTECATALDIDNIGIGMYSNQDARAFQCSSNFAGGTVRNVTARRATVGTSDHSTEITFCSGQTFENIESGPILYTRSSGLAINVPTCQNLIFNNCRVFNGNLTIGTSKNITINDLDYNDANIGRTYSTTPYYGISVAAGCDNIVIDGMTCGLGGTLEDCHPYNGLVGLTATTNCKVRNLGTPAAPISLGTWLLSGVSGARAVDLLGNNNTIKVQKVFIGKSRGGNPVSALNSDKNIIIEQALSKPPFGYGTKGAYTSVIPALNLTARAVSTGAVPATGQTSVYGTHFYDFFLGNERGALQVVCNEPTTETAALVTVNSGPVYWTSAGGVEMRVIGNSVTWEMAYYAKGHTGFADVVPTLTGGGAIGNFRFKYQIDKNDGNGWSTITAQLTAAELQASLYAQTGISATNGFKLKVQIDTTSTNTAAVTFLTIWTTTDWTTQEAVAYPLDTNTLTITGLQTGSDVVIYEAGTTTVLGSVDANPTTSWAYVYSGADSIDIGVFKNGFVPFFIRGLVIGTTDASVPVAQASDRNYAA